MPVHEHRVDSEKGSGSRSEMGDEMVGDKWVTKDQRADTWTTFFESDIEQLPVSRRRKWRLKRMARRQEGENSSETYYSDRNDRTQQNREEDRRRDVETFCSQLDLTPHQKKRVKHIILDVVSINSYGNYSAEEVILGAITYVCMEDLGESGVHVDDRKDFHRLVSELDTDMQRVKGARKLTRKKLR